jgi:hypothetical protein
MIVILKRKARRERENRTPTSVMSVLDTQRVFHAHLNDSGELLTSVIRNSTRNSDQNKLTVHLQTVKNK